MTLLAIAAANRDPSRFPQPDRWMLERRPTQHLSFSVGEHFCLGSHLARAELLAALELAVVDAVRRANERLARVEQLKRIQLMAGPWLPGGDELTPTLKLKRKEIGTKYAAIIDSMYHGDGIGV
jgi:hypothetical protein